MGYGKVDIRGAEKYPTFEFRACSKKNMGDRKYQGYSVVTKEEFPDLTIGYNDSNDSTLTYRDIIWMFRTKEIQNERRQAKRDIVRQQTILNNGIPRKFVEDAGGDLEKAMDLIEALPSGLKPGTVTRVPKGEAS
jgi:hypothetical protein